MIFRLVNLLRVEVAALRCASKIARSCSIGLFIAFSPYVGLHNIMVLALSWLLGLSLPLTFVIAHVNNPWTMVPIYAADYAFGSWLLSFLGIELGFSNPSCIDYCLSYTQHVGLSSFCFWTFIIGGTVLAIIIAVPSFFIIRNLVARKPA